MSVPDQQVVDLLRAHWSSLLQSAEEARGAALRAALRTLRNVVAVGDDIYFAFEHDFAKQRVERPDDKKVVEDLIAQLGGPAGACSLPGGYAGDWRCCRPPAPNA